ncbi:MAG: hypothetical protein QM759_02065 [Terricaulis sp.]
MITGLFALCVLVMRCFPETALARWLNANLVERPLAWLSRLRRRDVILLFVMIALLLVANDVIMLFGAGELLAIGVNLSVYFDAVLVATAVTIAATVATAWRAMRARLATWLRAAALWRARVARRVRSRTRRTPKSLSDDDAPALAFAG